MVRYKNGRDSISTADEQKAETLLTALKAEVAATTTAATTQDDAQKDTVLPVVPVSTVKNTN